MVLAEDLRQAVLQAALQGKLTEQLETDSDVDEFVVQIKRTKKDLVDAKAIKKESNISDICEEEFPCSIPDNWRFEKLGNLFYIERGASPRPISAYITTAKDGVNWVKIGDTEVGGKYVNFTKEKITKEGAEKSRAVKVGDFIFSNSMSFGRPYIMNIDGCIHDGWNVIHNIHSVDSDIKEFNQDYLYYVLSSMMLKQQIIDKAEGGVVKNIRSDNLRDLVMPIPPIEEQQRIVDKINEIMPKIDEYEKIEKELEALKKEFPNNMKDALLQAAMQGKLTEQLESDSSVDELLASIRKEKEELIAQKIIKKEKPLSDIEEEEIPFDIPENWKWVRMGNVGTLTRGSGIKRNEVTEAGFPCVRYGELYTTYKTRFDVAVSHTSKELFDKSQKVNRNDILMALTGENNFDIALALAYVGDETVAMGGDLTRWSNHHMNPLYLVYTMNSSYAIHKKSEMAKGDIIVHISNEKLSTILLPIPPIEEQNRIVVKLDTLLPLCEALKEV